MTAKAKASVNKTARLAGALYLGMIPFNVLGVIYVRSALVEPGDAATTATNIMASEGLFRSSIVSHLIGQAIFIFLVLTLFKLLEQVNKGHALLMAVLALTAVPIAFLNEINHFAVLLLLSGSDYLTAFDTDQLQAQAMLFLDLREYGILIALIFWGLWLFPLGYLVLRSGFFPRVLGVLLMIGGFGYLVDSVLTVLHPSSDLTISQFTFVGELLFPLWLLVRGVKVEPWEERAPGGVEAGESD